MWISSYVVVALRIVQSANMNQWMQGSGISNHPTCGKPARGWFIPDIGLGSGRSCRTARSANKRGTAEVSNCGLSFHADSLGSRCLLAVAGRYVQWDLLPRSRARRNGDRLLN